MTRKIFFPVSLFFLVSISLSVTAWAETSETQKPSSKGTITGSVTLPEKNDKEFGMVAFFDADQGLPPGPGTGRRIPDAKAPLRPDGSFTTTLTPGRYYIGVILGRAENQIGPPTAKEHSFVAFDAEGKPRIFTVTSGEIKQVGAITGQVPDLKTLPQPPHFTVTGKVTGPDGKPLAGIKVIAVQIEREDLKAVYANLGTANDGSYSLELSPDKPYFITVRADLGGGPPEPGEFIGRYGEDNPKQVRGKAGEVLTDIDIRVIKIPEHGESGKKELKKPQAGAGGMREKQERKPE